MLIKRGDLFWVSLDPVKGSEQAGRRPVCIIQNDVGNEYASTTIVAPLTTAKFARKYPTNVVLLKGTAGLKSDSIILLSQIRVIDKIRLEGKVGHLTEKYMDEVDEAVKVSLGLR